MRIQCSFFCCIVFSLFLFSSLEAFGNFSLSVIFWVNMMCGLFLAHFTTSMIGLTQCGHSGSSVWGSSLGLFFVVVIVIVVYIIFSALSPSVSLSRPPPHGTPCLIKSQTCIKQSPQRTEGIVSLVVQITKNLIIKNTRKKEN